MTPAAAIARAVREPVEKTPRRQMTKARKMRAHAASEGLCRWCKKPVEVVGPEVVYDHWTPLAIGGDDDDGPNLAPLHAVPCNKIKTAHDKKIIAKAERLRRKEAGERKPSRLKSKGFDKTRSRRMNGKVTARKAAKMEPEPDGQ